MENLEKNNYSERPDDVEKQLEEANKRDDELIKKLTEESKFFKVDDTEIGIPENRREVIDVIEEDKEDKKSSEAA